MVKCSCCKMPVDIPKSYDKIKLEVINKEITDKFRETQQAITYAKRFNEEYEHHEKFAEGLAYSLNILSILKD